MRELEEWYGTSFIEVLRERLVAMVQAVGLWQGPGTQVAISLGLEHSYGSSHIRHMQTTVIRNVDDTVSSCD